MSSSNLEYVETQANNTTEAENEYKPNTRKRSYDSRPDDKDEVKKTKVLSDYERKQFFEHQLDIQLNKIEQIFQAITTDTVDESLKCLIKNGINIYVQQKDTGYTLLHTAAHCSDHVMFKLLLDNNFNVNAKANNNVTPLHLAAWVGNIDIVKMLIERGADVNCLTEEVQLTPLHLATMKYDMKNIYNSIIKLSSSGQLFFLNNLERKEITQHRNQVTVIKCLIENGANINVRDVNNNAPLHYATLTYDKNVIEMLLKLGAYVDVMNIEGNSPLHNTLKSFNVDGLACLLEYGTDINDFNCQFKNIQEYGSSKANSFCNNVLEHTNKLRAADLPVAEAYKSEFHKSFWESHRSECLREVERLKMHIIVDNVSLYEFLHMGIRRRRAYIQNIPLDLEMKFPKYYSIVYGSYHQALTRRSLIELSKIVWDHLTEIDLPDVCFERIFFFLPNTDLTFFISGAHYFLKNMKIV